VSPVARYLFLFPPKCKKNFETVVESISSCAPHLVECAVAAFLLLDSRILDLDVVVVFCATIELKSSKQHR